MFLAIGFSPENFINALPVVGLGVLGIFIILGVMYGILALFQILFKAK